MPGICNVLLVETRWHKQQKLCTLEDYRGLGTSVHAISFFSRALTLGLFAELPDLWGLFYYQLII